jgi:integrase
MRRTGAGQSSARKTPPTTELSQLPQARPCARGLKPERGAGSAVAAERSAAALSLIASAKRGSVRTRPHRGASKAWCLRQLSERSATPITSCDRSESSWAQLDGSDRTPREMRHSFVSLLSDSGVPIEQIARLVGHAGGSDVTETGYRHQIRPVLLEGATIMDGIFGAQEAG